MEGCGANRKRRSDPTRRRPRVGYFLAIFGIFKKAAGHSRAGVLRPEKTENSEEF